MTLGYQPSRRSTDRGHACLSRFGAASLVLVSILLAGCPSKGPTAGGKGVGAPRSVRFAPMTPTGGIARREAAAQPAVAMAELGPASPRPTSGPVNLATPLVFHAAGNELVHFTLELADLPADLRSAGRLSVRLSGFEGVAPLTIPPADVEMYEIVDVPADMNRVGQVRHAGQASDARSIPRALLPLMAERGAHRLPAEATSVGGVKPADQSFRLWVDLKVPAGTPAGQYAGRLDLLSDSASVAEGSASNAVPARPAVVAGQPIQLNVYGFSLPTERRLKLAGVVTWDQLVRHWPDDFETVTPHLVNRGDRRYEGTLRTLDALQALAQRHRAGVVFDRLQPVVKWPALVQAAPPVVHWDEFDDVVAPWLDGTAFADGVGIGAWFVPEPDPLGNYDSQSRLAYWERATSHFDRRDWLKFSPVWIRHNGGRPRADRAIELSIEAARLLAMHPRVQVAVPLEPGQVQVGNPDAANALPIPNAVDPAHTQRLWTAAPSLISARQDWPRGVRQPKQTIRADLPGLIHAAASGNEQDVRLWSWLAYLREADMAVFSATLPAEASPATPADPADLVWFYPGKWFNRPDLIAVPSVQLKWLRQGEQDYEYLQLARERGELMNTRVMARLMCKPVMIDVGQAPDESYAMMTGTTDAAAWAAARPLLAKMIQLRDPAHPGQEPDRAARDAMEIEFLDWCRPQERPVLAARSANWSLSSDRSAAPWLSLDLGLDLYNAADINPGNNDLRWRFVPTAWQMLTPRPVPVPALEPYRVMPLAMSAVVNLPRVTPATRRPVELELRIDSTTASFVTPLQVALPVAPTDRRGEGRFKFDGRLDDWSEIDQFHDGPLVKLKSRPAVLSQKLERTDGPAKLYSNWHTDNLYVAFSVPTKGRPAAEGLTNFINYQSRRAWGEDLCEVLVQPIYSDNSTGPLLHVVMKPNGSVWVERRLDPKKNADPWEPFEGAGTRYAASLGGENWTGELAIPWKILAHPQLELPRLLRFNFTQHRHATGESASWAGPVDFGRDDALTGVLYLPLPFAGNPGDAVRGPGTPGVIER
jgi:hypothetical protein